ncbi:MAG: FKBP-type peptidyl-prolyl cis-trans isomerase [Acidobacteriota bacterium]
MRKFCVLAALLLFISATAACGRGGAQVTAGDLESVQDKASYGAGLNLGRNIRQQGGEVDIDILAQGLRDGLAGSEPLLSDEELQRALGQYQQELAARKREANSGLAAANKAEGEAFLETNGQRQGIVTLPSGLQYEVIEEGTGASPTATDRVTVHYTGTLIDGTVFDSSRQRGQPATFPLDKVIPGWTEGLQLMKVGSSYKFYIPAELAYGENPPSPTIGPNASLIFEVELLSIEKQ